MRTATEQDTSRASQTRHESAAGRFPRPRLPGLIRTVRWRLTVLYGILFLVSGAVLLAIAGGIVLNRSSSMAARGEGTAPVASSESARLAKANLAIAQLQHQLAVQASYTQSAVSRALLLAAAIGLGFMTLGSLVMGWVVAGRLTPAEFSIQYSQSPAPPVEGQTAGTLFTAIVTWQRAEAAQPG